MWSYTKEPTTSNKRKMKIDGNKFFIIIKIPNTISDALFFLLLFVVYGLFSILSGSEWRETEFKRRTALNFSERHRKCISINITSWLLTLVGSEEEKHYHIKRNCEWMKWKCGENMMNFSSFLENYLRSNTHPKSYWTQMVFVNGSSINNFRQQKRKLYPFKPSVPKTVNWYYFLMDEVDICLDKLESWESIQNTIQKVN